MKGEFFKIYFRVNEINFFLADEPENPFGGGFPFPGGFPFGQQQQQETPRGDDIVVPLLVTLEELFLGTKVTLIQTEKSVRDAPGTRDCNCRIEMKTIQVIINEFDYTELV